MISTNSFPKELKIAQPQDTRPVAMLTPEQFLEFSIRKFNAIVDEVLTDIIRGLGSSKKINLIVPLNGGLIFYFLLMRKLFDLQFYANSINVIFCDEDDTNEIIFSKALVGLEDRDSTFNLVIDDIWDKGRTGTEICEALNLDQLAYFAFCKKKSSPLANSGAFLANRFSSVTFPDEWLYSWGGMNSGRYNDAEITALERMSYLPLIPKPGVNVAVEDMEFLFEYIWILQNTNLYRQGVLSLDEYQAILFLEETPDLKTRFEYLRCLHSRYLSPQEG